MPRQTPTEINSYDSAATFLAAGKKSKTDRPHGHARRIIKGLVAPGTISVVYHKTPIVTWYPDGSTIVYFAGWMTATTTNHIDSYADLRPHGSMVTLEDGTRDYVRTRGWRAALRITGRTSPNGAGTGLAITTDAEDWPRTPAKVQKCRMCSGTSTIVRGWATGRACDCDGGRRDYGSKLIPIETDGTQPILLSPTEWAPPTVSTWNALVGGPVTTYACTCKLCTSGASSWQDYYGGGYDEAKAGHVPVTQPPADYSDSGDTLTKLLPALKTYVGCPACDTTERRMISERIIHLNDQHKWTREQIADWLESLDADLSFPV